jgi:raffinose/stachyose/melibiose transport system substrate-binding protein
LNKSFSKDGFLAALAALAKWKPYLPQGYQALAYPDSQNLFAQGRGAIYPAGSWDIGILSLSVLDRRSKPR